MLVLLNLKFQAPVPPGNVYIKQWIMGQRPRSIYGTQSVREVGLITSFQDHFGRRIWLWTRIEYYLYDYFTIGANGHYIYNI